MVRMPETLSPLFALVRRLLAAPEGGLDLVHGGAAIGLALTGEPLLIGAEVGDAGLDPRLEVAPGAASSVVEVSTGSRLADLSLDRVSMDSVPALCSASGFLPVTDSTNAMVCAIRRSRSFIHFMKHLGSLHSNKGASLNQGGGRQQKRIRSDLDAR